MMCELRSVAARQWFVSKAETRDEDAGVRLSVVARPLYYVAALVLLAATAGVLVTTAVELAHDGFASPLSSAFKILDRILLAFILLELEHSIRIVLSKDGLVAEPFLIIGLIAVVRRIVLVTGEAEQRPMSNDRFHALLLELGVLALLVLALGAALYLLRSRQDRRVAPPRGQSRLE